MYVLNPQKYIDYRFYKHTSQNVSSSFNNRGVLHVSRAVPVQIFDFHVQLLEGKIGNVRYASTAVRQHQRPRDVKNDPRRVFEKHLQVGTRTSS